MVKEKTKLRSITYLHAFKIFSHKYLTPQPGSTIDNFLKKRDKSSQRKESNMTVMWHIFKDIHWTYVSVTSNAKSSISSSSSSISGNLSNISFSKIKWHVEHANSAPQAPIFQQQKSNVTISDQKTTKQSWNIYFLQDSMSSSIGLYQKWRTYLPIQYHYHVRHEADFVQCPHLQLFHLRRDQRRLFEPCLLVPVLNETNVFFWKISQAKGRHLNVIQDIE